MIVEPSREVDTLFPGYKRRDSFHSGRRFGQAAGFLVGLGEAQKCIGEAGGILNLLVPSDPPVLQVK